MIDILFENDEIVACVKPVGVPSQKDGAEDMVSLLTGLSGKKIYPVHRLDTAVGGTMVFAKSSKAAAKLLGDVVNDLRKNEGMTVLLTEL